MKNFEKLLDNLEPNLEGGDHVKEVKEYMKITKQYKKQYRENLEKHKRDSLTELMEYQETTRGEDQSNTKNGRTGKKGMGSATKNDDAWECRRINDEQAY